MSLQRDTWRNNLRQGYERRDIPDSRRIEEWNSRKVYLNQSTDPDKYQLFDPLTDEEYAELKESIRQNGVLVPVELDEDGSILDGHHRVRAWNELVAEGVELEPYTRFIRPGLTEEEKRNHVRTLNVVRRQLSKEKRAEHFAAMRADGMTLQQIADVVGVNPSTVKRALDKSVFANAKTDIPETTVGKDGKVYPTSKPRKSAVFVKDDAQQKRAQSDIRLVDTSTGEILSAKELAKLAAAPKKQQRIETLQNTAAALPEGVYSVIYADPAWEYQNNGIEAAAAKRYPTMPTADICALLDTLNIQPAKDAALLLWATNPLLPDALAVMEAWNFRYVTNRVWIKERCAGGFHVNGRHELLLIGVRGSIPPSVLLDSVIDGGQTVHSRKPELYGDIERAYPGQRYIELFARWQPPRDGWTFWGNEANE